VARAWVDPAYRGRLLADGTAAIEELGFGGVDLQVVENTPGVHNLVVCTLCSCYPHALIGLPPVWYKSFEYRSRAVREPRVVLRRTGGTRTWAWGAGPGSLGPRAGRAGTGRWGEAELAALVPRDAMIGVAVVKPPAAAGRGRSRRWSRSRAGRSPT